LLFDEIDLQNQIHAKLLLVNAHLKTCLVSFNVIKSLCSGKKL